MKNYLLHKRTLVLFFSLSFYIIAQFSWWAYLLIATNKKLYELIGQNSAGELEIDQLFHQKVWMILGEGTVFFILLIFGFYLILRTFKKEMQLAQQHQNFMLSITHELKTPIATIKLYLETLIKRDLPKEKIESIYQTTLNETERLNQLIENILIASRTEDAQLFSQSELINLSDFTHELLQKLPFDKKQLKTNIQPHINYKIVPFLYETIVANLTENGLKYTTENCELEITLSQNNSYVMLCVKDNGIGIPDAHKLSVFNRFYRLENENTRKTKGTGLGLFIVHNIVKFYKGKINIKDNSPKGTIFEVLLKK